MINLLGIYTRVHETNGISLSAFIGPNKHHCYVIIQVIKLWLLQWKYFYMGTFHSVLKCSPNTTDFQSGKFAQKYLYIALIDSFFFFFLFFIFILQLQSEPQS